MEAPRCAACGGARLLPPTLINSAPTPLQLTYKMKPGFFGTSATLNTVARPCLDCGHVMLFLTPESLELARSSPVLTPIPV